VFPGADAELTDGGDDGDEDASGDTGDEDVGTGDSGDEDAGTGDDKDIQTADVTVVDSIQGKDSEELLCEAGSADCDGDKDNGCEAELMSSNEHCGKCDSPCSVENGTAMCEAGECKIECASGWSGDECLDDIDECTDGTNNCDKLAACSNTPGSFECTCPAGYEGDGTTCTPIDECALGTVECDENATCTDTDIGYDCTCNPGFTGDGLKCADIDECLSGIDDCDENALCTNTQGAFECECMMGFTGDGKSCEKDEPEPSDCSAAFFTGKNCIVVPDVFAEAMTEYTIEFWLRVDTYEGKPDYATVIDQFAGTSLNEPGLRISYKKSGTWSKKLHFQETSVGGGAQGQFFYEDFLVSEWKHVAFVRTPKAGGGAKVCQYIGGENKQCATLLQANPAPTNLENLRIGCENANVNITNYVIGAMDELRISNVARYTNTFDPDKTFTSDDFTVLLLHFDEALVDASPNGFLPVWEGAGEYTDAADELTCPL
jgi:hypothetical protein